MRQKKVGFELSEPHTVFQQPNPAEHSIRYCADPKKGPAQETGLQARGQWLARRAGGPQHSWMMLGSAASCIPIAMAFYRSVLKLFPSSCSLLLGLWARLGTPTCSQLLESQGLVTGSVEQIVWHEQAMSNRTAIPPLSFQWQFQVFWGAGAAGAGSLGRGSWHLAAASRLGCTVSPLLPSRHCWVLLAKASWW